MLSSSKNDPCAIEGRRRGWDSPAILATLALAMAAAFAFISVERRQAEPMLPLELFSSRTFSIPVGAAFLYNLAYYGALFILPMVLQSRDKQPLEIGVLLLPMTAATALLATASGWIVRHTGPRLLACCGMLAGAGGAALLLAGDVTPWSMAFGGLLIGISGVALPLIVAAALSGVPAARVGIGSAVLNSARQSGGALGVALLGAMLHGAPLQADTALLAILLAFVAGAVLVYAGLPRQVGSVG